ncbi:hypothetical protein BDY17DRAFT_147177 [Neohortaea acidophila]|uniref:Uncharacterized protein n=1 Tax=Neohortaea acidophila TaxID=245834 RepID=A0A6A6PTG8_9PEZI|nr:uncharacterized protein BDY17DRAFT_147177 [Neohortaea acidophila]KAF2483408.1 hypothetical protein BDY17DRAFT_147177 [Neohortaea acidophila]
MNKCPAQALDHPLVRLRRLERRRHHMHSIYSTYASNCPSAFLRTSRLLVPELATATVGSHLLSLRAASVAAGYVAQFPPQCRLVKRLIQLAAPDRRPYGYFTDHITNSVAHTSTMALLSPHRSARWCVQWKEGYRGPAHWLVARPWSRERRGKKLGALPPRAAKLPHPEGGGTGAVGSSGGEANHAREG